MSSTSDFSKLPTSEQQMQPELISLIFIPLSFKKAPSIPISPNSFSIKATFSFVKQEENNFLIRVVFPAPKNPEIISTLTISTPFNFYSLNIRQLLSPIFYQHP